MKKIMILALAILLMTSAAKAQSFYARLGVGAALGLSYYSGFTGNRTITNTTSLFESKSASLGSGLNVNLGVGRMFSQYIGVELGFNEFIGFSRKINYTYEIGTQSQTSELKTSASSFQIIPALVITPGLEKINPYGRFGLIIGVISGIKLKENSTITTSGEILKATTNEIYNDKESGGIAIGYSAALGADYKLSDALCLFAEINLTGLHYSPKKGKVTKWTIDGVDQLPGKSTKDKEWEYVKKLDFDQEIPDGSPDQYLKQSSILSNVGISIGIKYSFGSSN